MAQETSAPVVKFRRYESIVNASALEPEELAARADLPCVVMEKIHGCNMSVVVARSVPGFDLAKRNSLLGNDRAFMGLNKMPEDFWLPHERLLRDVLGMHPEATQAVLFGELYGGFYPDEDGSATIAKAKPIQREILYCNERRFAAFDVCVDDAVPLPFDVLQALCAKHGVELVPVLATGLTFADAVRFPTHAPTTIPSTLGLPPIPERVNLMEGIVVRALGPGHAWRVKVKNDDFKDEAIRRHRLKGRREDGANLVVRAPEAKRYMVPARVTSALSKAGDGASADKLTTMIAIDVLRELGRDKDFARYMADLTTQLDKGTVSLKDSRTWMPPMDDADFEDAFPAGSCWDGANEAIRGRVAYTVRCMASHLVHRVTVRREAGAE